MNEPNWSQIDRDRIAELEAENKRLRKALEWYDKEAWTFGTKVCGKAREQIYFDRGKISREALKGKGEP